MGDEEAKASTLRKRNLRVDKPQHTVPLVDTATLECFPEGFNLEPLEFPNPALAAIREKIAQREEDVNRLVEEAMAKEDAAKGRGLDSAAKMLALKDKKKKKKNKKKKARTLVEEEEARMRRFKSRSMSLPDVAADRHAHNNHNHNQHVGEEHDKPHLDLMGDDAEEEHAHGEEGKGGSDKAKATTPAPPTPPAINIPSTPSALAALQILVDKDRDPNIAVRSVRVVAPARSSRLPPRRMGSLPNLFRASDFGLYDDDDDDDDDGAGGKRGKRRDPKGGKQEGGGQEQEEEEEDEEEEYRPPSPNAVPHSVLDAMHGDMEAAEITILHAKWTREHHDAKKKVGWLDEEGARKQSGLPRLAVRQISPAGARVPSPKYVPTHPEAAFRAPPMPDEGSGIAHPKPVVRRSSSIESGGEPSTPASSKPVPASPARAARERPAVSISSSPSPAAPKKGPAKASPAPVRGVLKKGADKPAAGAGAKPPVPAGAFAGAGAGVGAGAKGTPKASPWARAAPKQNGAGGVGAGKRNAGAK